MGDEEPLGERLARLDERVKTLEARLVSLDTRLWGAVAMILVYVANKVLGLIDVAGGVP